MTTIPFLVLSHSYDPISFFLIVVSSALLQKVLLPSDRQPLTILSAVPLTPLLIARHAYDARTTHRESQGKGASETGCERRRRQTTHSPVFSSGVLVMFVQEIEMRIRETGGRSESRHMYTHSHTHRQRDRITHVRILT